MMPLTLADIGTEQLIRKVGGSPEVRKHLEDLGFVAGGTVTVVSSLNGNASPSVKRWPARSWSDQKTLHKRRDEA